MYVYLILYCKDFHCIVNLVKSVSKFSSVLYGLVANEVEQKFNGSLIKHLYILGNPLSFSWISYPRESFARWSHGTIWLQELVISSNHHTVNFAKTVDRKYVDFTAWHWVALEVGPSLFRQPGIYRGKSWPKYH